MNKRPTSAVPSSLATRMTTSPSPAWPPWINASASNLTGNNSTLGSTNSASARPGLSC